MTAAANENADEELAGRAWRAITDIALDRDRKLAVSSELGMSWTRVLALKRLAIRPHTQRELAEQLAADPPYVTRILDDLQERGLLQRTTHPDDRRAKLVQLTRSGRVVARRADAILYEPPDGLRNTAPHELVVLLRVLESLRG